MPSARTAGAPDRAGHHRPGEQRAAALLGGRAGGADTGVGGRNRLRRRPAREPLHAQGRRLRRTAGTHAAGRPADRIPRAQRAGRRRAAPRHGHRRPAPHRTARSGAPAAALGMDDADVLRAVGRFLGRRRLRRSEAAGRRRRREVARRLHAHQPDPRRRPGAPAAALAVPAGVAPIPQRHLYPAAGHPRIRVARRRGPRTGRGAARLGCRGQ